MFYLTKQLSWAQKKGEPRKKWRKKKNLFSFSIISPNFTNRYITAIVGGNIYYTSFQSFIVSPSYILDVG